MVDVCEKCNFQVASVNQFGYNGYSSSVSRNGKSASRDKSSLSDIVLLKIYMTIYICNYSWHDISDKSTFYFLIIHKSYLGH